MVPKIHKKGTSFLSVHRYNAHDKNADTSHRLEWTHTINLGTDHPGTAARVMAATAMDSARLKQEAGVRNTGRKSNLHVFHATLSWHAEDSQDLSQEHMISTAKWFLDKLGAGDRQAVLYAHNDEPHPHVHIVMNRVSPKDGRILSSSMEKLKASKWAEKYERDRGKIYCDQRVVNNAARRRGEFVRGQKDEARHFHEMRQQAVNDNGLKAKARAEIERMRTLYHKRRQAERDHRMRQEDLQRIYQKRIAVIREGARKQMTTARQQVQQAFAGKWAAEYHESAAEVAAFNRREKEILGRAANAIESVNWRKLLLMQKGHPDGRAGNLAEAFNAFGDSEARLRALMKQQALRENAIKRCQNIAEAEAVARTRQNIATRLHAASRDLLAQRNHDEQQYRKLSEALDNQVRAANRMRRRSWKQMLAAKQEEGQRLSRLRAANSNRPPQKSAEQNTVPEPTCDKDKRMPVKGSQPTLNTTKPSELLPKEGAQQRAEDIDAFKQRMRKRELERKNGKDRGGRSR